MAKQRERRMSWRKIRIAGAIVGFLILRGNSVAIAEQFDRGSNNHDRGLIRLFGIIFSSEELQEFKEPDLHSNPPPCERNWKLVNAFGSLLFENQERCASIAKNRPAAPRSNNTRWDLDDYQKRAEDYQMSLDTFYNENSEKIEHARRSSETLQQLKSRISKGELESYYFTFNEMIAANEEFCALAAWPGRRKQSEFTALRRRFDKAAHHYRVLRSEDFRSCHKPANDHDLESFIAEIGIRREHLMTSKNSQKPQKVRQRPESKKQQIHEKTNQKDQQTESLHITSLKETGLSESLTVGVMPEQQRTLQEVRRRQYDAWYEIYRAKARPLTTVILQYRMLQYDARQSRVQAVCNEMKARVAAALDDRVALHPPGRKSRRQLLRSAFKEFQLASESCTYSRVETEQRIARGEQIMESNSKKFPNAIWPVSE